MALALLRAPCRYGEQMRAVSLKYVPTAVLSRQTAGIRGKALVINLPGGSAPRFGTEEC
jgi:molybdopterin biosynthesis enzyme MoaB